MHDFDLLKLRLINWARWCRTHPKQARAMSAEGGYRAPDWETLGPRPRTPIAADAWDIEVAVRLLPLDQHLLLKFRYVQKRNDSSIFVAMRKQCGVRLNTNGLIALENASVCALRDALDLPLLARQTRAQSRARRILRAPVHNSALTQAFAPEYASPRTHPRSG